jgi:membrane protein
VLTLVLSVGMLLALAFVTVVPALVGRLGLGTVQELLVTYLRWPILFVAAMAGIAILYRYGPCRRRAQVRWVNWGAVLATVLWLVASVGFSLYVRYFGSYNEVYGSLGAVVILLMWFWLSAYIVLLGAELNAEMEHQTGRDTTVGSPKPMGERGAYVADTLGEVP